MEATGKGEDAANLPGSQSVARAEGDARNWGGPESSCRTKCEGQAGREAQPKEARPEDAPGVRSARSTPTQGASPEVAEGADTLTQSAQATSPVRTTEQDWQTFLRAIAEKALMEGMRERGSVKSPVRENRPPGSVRGAPGNRRPYRDKKGRGKGMNGGGREMPAFLSRHQYPIFYWCLRVSVLRVC